MPQLPAGLVDPRLDGALGQAEQSGDLPVAQPEDVAQGHRLGEFGADRVERVEQVQPGAGDHARPARVGRVGQRHAAGLHPPAPAQHPVRRAGPVGGQPVQPGVERRPALEPADALGQGEQRVLAGLLGVLPVRQQPGAEPQHLRADRDQQRVERRRSPRAADSARSRRRPRRGIRSSNARRIPSSRLRSPPPDGPPGVREPTVEAVVGAAREIHNTPARSAPRGVWSRHSRRR